MPKTETLRLNMKSARGTYSQLSLAVWISNDFQFRIQVIVLYVFDWIDVVYIFSFVPTTISVEKYKTARSKLTNLFSSEFSKYSISIKLRVSLKIAYLYDRVLSRLHLYLCNRSHIIYDHTTSQKLHECFSFIDALKDLS